jgi:hypothetical protein
MTTITKTRSPQARTNGRRSQEPISQPTADDIRRRAYEIFRGRTNNGSTGDQVSDWIQAERELKEQARGEKLLHGDQE